MRHALVLLCLPAAALFVACRPAPSGPQAIVLVIVDTLRADHLGAYGYERPTTPQLDRWAERGALFENAFATSPWTLASVGSLYTGLLPERHGAGFKFGRRRFSGLGGDVPVLAEMLAERGYATAAVYTNVYLSDRFGLERGFAAVHDLSGDEARPPATAEVVVDRGLEWIDAEGDRPFFLSLHLLDPHLPYDPPPATRGRFTAGYEGPLELPFDELRRVRNGRLPLDAADREFIRAAYDEEVAFVDREVARLLEGLERRGVLDRGLVILTSDHGEELFDHGGFEHGHSLFQEVLRIPLMVWGQGVAPGRRGEPASLVDLLPTLAEAAGAAPPGELDGHSLWPAIRGGDAPADRQLGAQWGLYGPPRKAIVDWPYKAVLDLRDRRSRLYDLESDPGERRDLGAAHREVRDRLLADLARLLPAGRPPETRAVELDSRTEEQLRALGYLN